MHRLLENFSIYQVELMIVYSFNFLKFFLTDIY